MKLRILLLISMLSLPVLAQGTPPQQHGYRAALSGTGACTALPSSGAPNTSTSGAIIVSSLGMGSAMIDVGGTLGPNGSFAFWVQTKQQAQTGGPVFEPLAMVPTGVVAGAAVTSTKTTGSFQAATLPPGFTVCAQAVAATGPVDVQVIVSPAAPASLSQVNPGGGFTVGGDAGPGQAVVIPNDGGVNRIYCNAFALNFTSTGGADIVSGPSANICATDGGMETNARLVPFFLNGPGGVVLPPWGIVTQTPGQSLCVFSDAGVAWSGNCVYAQ